MDSPISWFLLMIAVLTGLGYLIRAIYLDREAHLSAVQEWQRLEDATRTADYQEFFDYAERNENLARRQRPLF